MDRCLKGTSRNHFKKKNNWAYENWNLVQESIKGDVARKSKDLAVEIMTSNVLLKKHTIQTNEPSNSIFREMNLKNVNAITFLELHITTNSRSFRLARQILRIGVC